MQRLERKVREYLDSQNWKYDFEQDKHRFIFGMSLDCADVDSCLMVVRIRDHEDISCRALYRFDVPADKRTAVSVETSITALFCTTASTITFN